MKTQFLSTMLWAYQIYTLTSAVATMATKATIGIICQIWEDLNLIGSIGVDDDFAGILLFAAVVVRTTSRSSGRSRPATATMMTCLAVFLLHPPSIPIYSIIRITTNKLECPSFKLTTTTANRTTKRAKRAKNFILFLISCLQRWIAYWFDATEKLLIYSWIKADLKFPRWQSTQ